MKGLFIGFDANGKKIFSTPEDRASTHMHVIGSSGSGKSKFLEWMIREDIKNGQGLCLIDPEGTLYEDIVQWAGYHWLTDRGIILLNPSSADHVIGFNPFRDIGGDIAVQVDYQITATIRAWGLENTDETPTLERWLRCIFQTLIEKRQTIIAARYLINYFENEVRDYLTSELSKEIIQEEWKELSSSKTPKQFQDEILSTKNKLFRFLCSDQIQRFMGLNEPALDIGKIMDEGKILLVNLADSESLSHANATLFGALLVNEFFQQAKKRKNDQWGNEPKPFYLYIDEFQDFVTTPDIGRMLDQVRKRGLHLILAHQRFGQIETKQADVIESVSTKGPSDTIKSHHNRVPEVLELIKSGKVIEPLKELFKDEVRRVGVELGMSEELIYRQPFPGPGLAIRVIGTISKERLDILREADDIFISEIKKAGLYRDLWQSFAVFLPVRSVGVMGDKRTYENVIALRSVTSTDAMTADWAYLPEDVMRVISNRIINEVKGVNRVVYDISSKPPSTIEWE